MTSRLTSPWPMSTRLAPSERSRSTSANRSQCADESALSEEVVDRLDDAELVALRVRFLGELTDVDVPAAKLQRPRHGRPLLL
jgi:hypothetical protein